MITQSREFAPYVWVPSLNPPRSFSTISRNAGTTLPNRIHRVRLPKKWEVPKKRILTPEQTAQVLPSSNDPDRLICETCHDTGTRISEVTGLMVKHGDPDKGVIRIEQRNFHATSINPRPPRASGRSRWAR